MDALKKAEEMVKVLNDAFKKDPKAIEMLFGVRVPCNKQLSEHPTIQVGKFEDSNFWLVGMIGIINGYCGTNKDGWGYVGIDYEGDKMKGFKLVNTGGE